MIPRPLAPPLPPGPGERETLPAVRHRRGEAGYNLVMLMVALSLFNILVAAALPKWSQAIRREREEELISRGWQYAEAIRVFQNRFQRLPVRLEELAEVEPRSIRKLWKDPMTDEGKWVLIPPGGRQPLRALPNPNGPGGQEAGPDGREEEGRGDDGGEELEPATGIGEKRGTVQVGPFIGVHSRSSKESILIFNGRDRYDEWHFTVEMLMGMGPGGGAGGGAGGNLGGGSGGGPGGIRIGGDPAGAGRGLQLSTRWLGRPLPAFLNVPQAGLPQDGRAPDSGLESRH